MAKRDMILGLLVIFFAVICIFFTFSLFCDKKAKDVERIHGDSFPTERKHNSNPNTATQPTEIFQDTEIAKFRGQIIDKMSKGATSLAENPVHHWRLDLQKQMRNESARESFERLTDNDNMKLLMPLMAGRPFEPGCYASDVRIVSKMTRVRKLLAEAQKNPEAVSSYLQEQLLSNSENFPAIHKEFMQKLKNAEEKLTFKQLPEIYENRLLNTAAAYVLSEIRAYDALPALARLSKQGTLPTNIEFGGSCPLNRKFLFYSMHQLVKDFPKEGLSKEAQEYWDYYMKRAETYGISEPRQKQVATWDAYYHEDDFRSRMLGIKLYTEDQPTMKITEYPDLRNLSRSKLNTLLRNMRSFIEAAFPAQ